MQGKGLEHHSGPTPRHPDPNPHPKLCPDHFESTYRDVALAAVVAVVVHGQADARTARGGGAVLPQPLHLAPVLDLFCLKVWVNMGCVREL